MVRQEENLKNTTHIVEESPEVTAYAAQTRSLVKQYCNDDRDKTVVCKHCQRSSHVSDRCYVVIGYLKLWGDCPNGK